MEEKTVKTYLQIEQEAEEQLNMFVFIVFVPNPMNKSVRLWIDGGEHETYMNIDRFLKVLSNCCDLHEVNKISVACTEYGTPFMYDRHKKVLKQLTELPPERNLKWSADYHKQYEIDYNDPYSVDSYFNTAKKAAAGINNFGLPNFDSESIRKPKT